MNLFANFDEAQRLLKLVNTRDLRNTMQWLGDRCVHSILEGGKVLICGNGGSQCDSEHFAEELTGRLYKNRQAIPALSLSLSLGHMTCVANDYGYDAVFMRSIEAFGSRGDVLICLSTSGKSPSILKAAQKAQEMGIPAFFMLGPNPPNAPDLQKSVELDNCFGLVSNCINIPHTDSARIQEVHMFLLHSLAQDIEERVCPIL